MSTEFDLKVAQKFISLQSRCRDKKVPFGMTLMGLSNVLRAKRCYYTGKPFTDRDKLTLERVVPERGYVTGNVVAVRGSVNAARGNISVEDILAMAEKMKKHQGK